jgi:hypothetical protein
VLGQDASVVQVHEIFPKQLLASAGYSRAEVNAIANFAFLTPSSAISLSGLEPECRTHWVAAQPGMSSAFSDRTESQWFIRSALVVSCQ